MSRVPPGSDAEGCCSGQEKVAATATPDQTPQERFPKIARLIDYLLSLRGRADLKTLDRLLIEANLTREDIESACQFGTKAYRRNIIASTEHFELLALTWRSGHCTPIHDHEGVSCAFKVIHGTGTEIRFVMTPSGKVCPVGATPMPTGYICSAEEADIHQVANLQAPGQDVITLHIYSPRIKKMRTYGFNCSEGAEGCDAYNKPGV